MAARRQQAVMQPNPELSEYLSRRVRVPIPRRVREVSKFNEYERRDAEARERERARRRRAATRAWQRANPDKVRAATRAWQRANPDKVRAATRAYYEQHREKWRTVYVENRKRRLAAAAGATSARARASRRAPGISSAGGVPPREARQRGA